MSEDQIVKEEFKYNAYLIRDPDTPDEILLKQKNYLILTPEERREWRYENLPKMSQVCIWNFYWKYVRDLEDRDGEDALLDEINEDVPHLEEKLKTVMEEYEETKARYEQVIASRVEEPEAPSGESEEDAMQ